MKQLKVIEYSNGKNYFVDWRLRQLRNINNPHDFIDFRNDEEMAADLAGNLVKEVG